MKGAYIVLTKNGVEIKTQFVESGKVRWINDQGVEFISALHNDGFETVPRIKLNLALKKLEDLWDGFCWSSDKKIESRELFEILQLLRDA